MSTGKALIAVLVLALLVAAVPVAAQPEGAHHEPIAGMIVYTGGTDGDVRVTPSGIVHVAGGTSVTEFTGDVAGIVTFYYKRVQQPVDGSHLVSKGPFEGEVTWHGLTGTMRGMFTTNCRPDAEGFLSCEGTMIGHGSGELDGIKFHINWGPGFWPFPYEGFALNPHAG